jgi:hypothetical protein
MTYLLAAVALLAIGGAWWRFGWRGVAGALAALAALLGVAATRRRPPVVEPPQAPPGPSPVAREAERQVVARLDAEVTAIEAAASPENPDRLADLAADARRRARRRP